MTTKLPESLRRFLAGKPAVERPALRTWRRRVCGAGAPSNAFTRLRAAEYIQTSVPTMHRLERAGKLVPRRTGVNHPYYLQSELDAFLMKLKGGERS